MIKYTTMQVRRGEVVVEWKLTEKVSTLKGILLEAFPGIKSKVIELCNKLSKLNEEEELRTRNPQLAKPIEWSIVYIWGEESSYSFHYCVNNEKPSVTCPFAVMDEIARSIDINIQDSHKSKFLEKYGSLI